MTSFGEDPAVAVLYTIKPAAGDETGPAAFTAVSATLEGRKPLEEEDISINAELFGLAVPIPILPPLLI